MMSFKRFTGIFSAFGLLVPIVFIVFWRFFEQSIGLNAAVDVEKLMLVLFPASLMTLPASPELGFEIKLVAIATVTNVLFYSLIGALIWLGLRKHFLFLIFAGLILTGIWWKVLTM